MVAMMMDLKVQDKLKQNLINLLKELHSIFSLRFQLDQSQVKIAKCQTSFLLTLQEILFKNTPR